MESGIFSLFNSVIYPHIANITEATLVFQNNGTAAALVYQPSSVGIIEYFSYVHVSFYSN